MYVCTCVTKVLSQTKIQSALFTYPYILSAIFKSSLLITTVSNSVTDMTYSIKYPKLPNFLNFLVFYLHTKYIPI